MGYLPDLCRFLIWKCTAARRSIPPVRRLDGQCCERTSEKIEKTWLCRAARWKDIMLPKPDGGFELLR